MGSNGRKVRDAGWYRSILHPGEVYLGLVAPTAREVKPGAVLRPGVVAADPQGIRRIVKAMVLAAFLTALGCSSPSARSSPGAS